MVLFTDLKLALLSMDVLSWPDARYPTLVKVKIQQQNWFVAAVTCCCICQRHKKG